MLKRLLLALAVTLLCVPAYAQATLVPPAKTCFTGSVGQTGIIGLLGTLTPGAGGPSGPLTYSVSLIGGTGTGATATIIVSGGSVNSQQLTAAGQGYTVGDVLTTPPATIGGVVGYTTVVASTALNGALAGGSVTFYVPSTTTPKSTWQDAGEVTLNPNPVPLDGNGCASIFGVGSYRQIVKDNIGNTVWDQTVASATAGITYGAGVATALGLPVNTTGGIVTYPPVSFILNVRDLLPPNQPDGTTDNSAGFQTAANTLCAQKSNGGKIYVPAPTTASHYVAHDINNICGNSWEGAGPSGVGDAHQGPVVLGGAAVDYSGAAAYFMQWQVPGFPAFKSGAHINGGGITGFTLLDTATTFSWALVSEGTQDWKASNLIINGAQGGVYMKGDEFPVTSHISMYGTHLFNYQIVGDLTGQTQSGAACSTTNGDCSTRSDAWFGDYLTNIDNLNTNTVFTLTGFVATVTLTHTNGEGPAVGMHVSCPVGLDPNMGQCPSFGRFDDLQFEFVHGYPVILSDFVNFYFDHLYAVGDASSAAVNAVLVGSTNYASTSVPVGDLQITNSRLFAVNSDCLLTTGTVWDLRIINTGINGCNSGDVGANGINIQSSGSHYLVAGSQIGDVDNYAGSHPLVRGVNIGATAQWVNVHDDNFDGLTQTTNAASSSGTTVSWANNHMIAQGVVSFCDSTTGCAGTLPSGLTANTPYYVLSGVTSGLFQVSATPDGSPVTVGTAASFTALAVISPVWSISAFPGTIHVHDNQGPGSISPFIGPCGTPVTGPPARPGFANVAHDDTFIVTIGDGTPTSCPITFATPMWTKPACNVSLGNGAASGGLGLGISAQEVVLNGSALAGSYSVTCKAP